jgi:integrase
MSSLFKRGAWTLQYADDERTPKKKQFSLHTRSKRTAERLQAELDDLYYRGLFDPWTDDFRELLENQKRPEKPKRLISLREAKDAFIDSRQGLAEPTVTKYEMVTRLLCDHVGPMEVHAVQSDEVASYLQSGDLSLTSKHVYRRHLSVFFRWCMQKGWTKSNPAAEVSLQRKPEKRPKAFTKEEVDALADEADGYLSAVIVVASQTGLRRSEITRLQWEHVDLGRRELHVRGQTKSGKERTVPLSEETETALNEMEHHQGYVFYLDAPRFSIHPNTITQDFLRVRREVLPKKEGYSFHSLRHSFCTWLAEASTPIHVIKRLAGHATIDTTMKYVHALSDGHEHVDNALGGDE